MEQNLIDFIDYDIPNCIICHCQATNNLSSLYCGHIFHFNCIDKWLKKKKICPICRNKSKKEDINKINFCIMEKKFEYRKILRSNIKKKNKDIIVN